MLAEAQKCVNCFVFISLPRPPSSFTKQIPNFFLFHLLLHLYSTNFRPFHNIPLLELIWERRTRASACGSTTVSRSSPMTRATGPRRPMSGSRTPRGSSVMRRRTRLWISALSLINLVLLVGATFSWLLISRSVDADQMSNDVENPDKENTSPGPLSSCCDALIKQASVYGIAAGYCISASLLSIINKWAVMKFPYPGALTALQYLTSFLGVVICGWLKLIEHDKLDLLTMWRFLPAAFIFYLSLFTNSELLLHANVDTFIVFRSAVPIFVAIGETLYLQQPWPALKTWLSLATIFAGSVLYVITDYQFTPAAYSWALAYLVSMSVDFVYIKHVVMTIGLNTWGLVLYNNLEALLLFPLELLVMGELKKIERDDGPYSFGVVLPVGLSCLFGLAISFFGFSCRRAISATGFTVLGIVNKLLTVVINLVIWDKHSTVVGTVGLLICMAGGVMYQQSTSGKPKAISEVVKVGESSDEEKQKLIELQTVGAQKGDEDEETQGKS
ncbi:GDP-mannose transporter GONST3 [Striga asiatica]|uniref:GDP-mannose transporter GONST3 n=1 Tax=Striga asiatica TaxID=4170 RepID=A0A5A7RA78_STRAF|nr:GDP-mannose transporter GONST3 [Striga asiatica]